MEKVNGCLKRLFISFNTLFAILGGLMIYGAIKSSAYSHQMSAVSSPVWGWVFAIGVLGISCLGIYAGSSEKEIVLKIFAGLMVVGMIIMLVLGIIMVVTRNKIISSFDSTESFMKNEEFRTMLDGIQQEGQCCGVVSASDWGDNIPSSCKCSGYGGFRGPGCTSKPLGVSGPDLIYAQPCKYIFLAMDYILKIALGLYFGFAVIALLGLLLSVLMIRQIRHHNGLGGTSIAMRGY